MNMKAKTNTKKTAGKVIGLAFLTAAGIGVAGAIGFKALDRSMRTVFEGMELSSERIPIGEKINQKRR